ncbi:uracil-DNA glycosylase [Persephonella sp.]|nr:uracil-DNA glycosylase [Aquificota bacterium]
MGLKKHIRILQELGYEYLYLEREMENTVEEKLKKLEEINRVIQECKKCDLHKNRTQAVLGEGNPDSRLVFIGEAPGGDEDKQGRPFVGRAGKLLTRLIEATGHKREEFYITNVCKCRPPGNRTPTPWEMEACFPYLRQQLDIIQPKVLCLLGATAARAFLNRHVAITKERGSVINWEDKLLYLTYHPAYVLRNPSEEMTLFEDIKRAIQLAYS